MVLALSYHDALKSAARAVLLFAVFAVALLFSADAEAKYSVCNETSYVLDVATGKQKGNQTITRGWTQVLPGQCKTVLKEKLEQKKYYLFARTIGLYDQVLKRFSGGKKLCVSTSDFYIENAGKCVDPAHSYENFIEVKPTKSDWKTTLNEEKPLKLPEAATAGLQRLLAMAGYDIGAIDGVAGGMTNRALDDFMQKAGLAGEAKTGGKVFAALISAVLKRQKESGLLICNETRFLIWTTLGQHEGEDIITRGWYKVLPGECIRPLRKPLDGQVVYSYGEAVDEKGKIAVKSNIRLIWAGKQKLCTSKTRFSIPKQGNCKERGLNTTAFRKIDLGGAKSWTIRYTEPQ